MNMIDNFSQKLKTLLIENTLIKSNLLLYFVLAILVLKIIGIGIHIPLLQNFLFADITKIDLVNLLNQSRKQVGVGTLKESAILDQVAMAKAQDMVKNGYFAHESPTGITPWFWFRQAGYVYKYAGENLAVGFADSETVYNAWVNSPSHKANLLNTHYTEVGTAVVTGFQGNAILVVQEFGSPLTSIAPVSTTTPPKSKIPAIQNPTSTTPTKTLVVEKSNKNVVIETIPAAEDEATPQDINSHVSKQVLGMQVEYIAPPETIGSDNFYYRFLNFIIYQYAPILEYISFGLILLIVFLWLFSILSKTGHFNGILMIKSLVLVIILAVNIIIDKDIISQILSHQIII